MCCIKYPFPRKPIDISRGVKPHWTQDLHCQTFSKLFSLKDFSSNISHFVYLLILSFSHFPSIVWSYFFRLIKVGQIVCSIQLPLQLLQFGLHQTISSLWTKKGDTTVAANFVQCLCNFDVLLPVTHPQCPCLFADWQFRPKQRSLPKQTGGNRKTETEDLKRIPPAAAVVDKLSLDLVSHQKTIFFAAQLNWPKCGQNHLFKIGFIATFIWFWFYGIMKVKPSSLQTFII